VSPEFREFQHILWRESPHDKVVEYELNTVTYGVNCAPFLALRVLQCIADDNCAQYSRVRDALSHQNVDDICYAADDISGALAIHSDLISILARSGGRVVE